MRKKIIAGNWKMNNNLDQTKKLIKQIKQTIAKRELKNTRIMIAPAFVNLERAVKNLKKTDIEVIAQNMHQSQAGAFTGEVCADMLNNIGIKTVILGHSERRNYFNETYQILSEKVDIALSNQLEIIFCIGEQLEDRNSGNHFKIIESQLLGSLFHLEQDCWDNIIIAYEPVWAIGTNQTASPEQAQQIHNFIRNLIAKKYGKKTADAVSILYGGSVKPTNAGAIFSKPDVDGGLIGGASLKAKDFKDIINQI